MKRYLVTGAQGFVGRFVVAKLLQTAAPEQILGVGRSPANGDRFTHSVTTCGKSIPAPLPGAIPTALLDDERYDYLSVDLQDRTALARVLAEYSPHYIIHLASGLFGDPVDKLFRCNVEGTVHLLDAIQANSPIERVIIGSSGGVYGAIGRVPIVETDPAIPIHLYSVSKLACELAAGATARQRGLPLVFARIFNIVGPGQDERHACGRWMQQLVALANSPNPELRVGSLDASRDFIDVRDTASAVVHLCHHGTDRQIYNVATGIETTMRRVMQHCVSIAGLASVVQIHESETRAVDIPRHVADIAKLTSTGWSARFSLEESLRDLHHYYTETVRASAAQPQVEDGDVGKN